MAVLLGLLVVAAVAVAYFRASYAKATIETLKEDNEALRNRVETLEEEDRTKQTKIEHLRQENEALRDLVTNRVEIDTLTIQLQHHHTQALALLEENRSLLILIKKILEHSNV